MRKFLKWTAYIVLGLALMIAIAAFWKREELARLMAVNSLFSEEKIVTNFSNMNAAFLSTIVARGDGPVTELPDGPAFALPASVANWVEDRSLTSLLIVKNGEVVFEDYYLGTGPDDQRISWSMAKSYLSALMGILLDEGMIDSLDDPVTKYAPLLIGSAYDGATLRNVLNMASGVVFNEDYLDYDSDINQMGRVLALGGTLDEFAAGLTETQSTPGTRWQYVSIDTHVLGMVIRGATGQSVAKLLSDRIISKLGQQTDAYYVTDGAGVAFVLGGLNITTRDYTRFAMMIEADGMWNGEQIVPAAWIAESTAPSAPTAAGNIGYGYQWWIPQGSTKGQFLARGVYGQHIYIDQNADTVIVSTAADRQFRNAGVGDTNVAIFRQIVDALKD